jgi:hypothetical protein
VALFTSHFFGDFKMALNLRALVLTQSTPHSSDLPPVNWYNYASPDAAATILTVGYFNLANKKLNVGDSIWAMALAGTAGSDRLDLIVTAIAAGVVTVAVNTSASGA